MGGTIGLSSRPGEGSTFWFTTCLAASTNQSPSQRGSMDDRDVLLVRAGSETSGFLRSQLERLGARVTEGSVDSAKRFRYSGLATPSAVFSAVVVDVPASWTDGLPVVQVVRSHKDLATIPMITLGDSPDTPSAAELPSPGIFEHMVRPVRFRILSSAMERLVHRAGPGKITPALKSLLKRNVLVAEDNATNQVVSRLLLERLGCSVDIVTNGQEACEAMRSREYDLVFMDCQMPVMDGFEATRRTRLAESGRRTPIIAFTAGVLLEERESCYAAGMDDFLSKPTNAVAFSQAVQRWAGSTVARESSIPALRKSASDNQA